MLAFVCGGALILVGCTAGQEQTTMPPPAPNSAPAEQVIRSYYAAMARGDTATLNALMTDNWRREMADSDNRTLPRISVANLEIGPVDTLTMDTGRLQSQKDYAAVKEAFVQFDLLEDTPFERAGRTGTYVMVAQETTGSPWRIDGEGTGP